MNAQVSVLILLSANTGIASQQQSMVTSACVFLIDASSGQFSIWLTLTWGCVFSMNAQLSVFLDKCEHEQ